MIAGLGKKQRCLHHALVVTSRTTSAVQQLFLMDDDLLYGDIESSGKDVEIERLQTALEAERRKNETLAAEVAQLQEQVKGLVSDRTQLETNMMTIYNTARLEVKRKDNEIADLRGQLSRR
jgi:hypothetical protein